MESTTTDRINQDYLLVSEIQPNGTLTSKRMAIAHLHSDTEVELAAMVENPNRTLLDVQDRFFKDVFSQKYHHICLLHEYHSSYINGVHFPKAMSYDEYCSTIDEKRRALELGYTEKKEDIDSEEVESELEKYKTFLKKQFVQTASRYIVAEDYMYTYERAIALPNLKAISTERIGWSTFEHSIGDDIVITIQTNFGYGNSAYFRANMRYKGIDILPYADVVRYPIARMQDLTRATRSYDAVRKNWHLAMDFIVGTSNLAVSDEEKFLSVWIKNEVDEMMSRLRAIKSNPDAVVNYYKESVEKPTPYLALRNFTKKEVEHYYTNHKEMPVALKCAKFSGALMFLENLQAIAKVFGYVDNALQELKELALSVIPEIDGLLNTVNLDVARLETEHAEAEKALAEVELLLEPVEEELKLIIAKPENQNRESWKIRNDFFKNNPEYRKLRDDRDEKGNKVRKLYSQLFQRSNFRDSIEEQKELILTQTAKI